MGLAASQARFLGITLRKANLEFKSTELAQQRLELTNQMSQISEEYSSAINATQLSWHNDSICDENGNPVTYGLTYSLLMMPSEANGYNPYMVTTKAGAVVLNTKYQEAAKAAGISMAGGLPSEEGYKKFIKALGTTGGSYVQNGTTVNINGQELITHTTEQTLLNQSWHSTAGLGAIPKDKSTMDQQTLSGLITSDDFGGVTLDWLQVFRSALGYNYDDMSSNVAYTEAMASHEDDISKAKLRYSKAGKGNPHSTDHYGTAYVNEQASLAQSQVTVVAGNNQPVCSGIMAQFQDLENKISTEVNRAKKLQYTQELEYLKQGLNPSGGGLGSSAAEQYENTLKYPLFWEVYEKAKFEANIGTESSVLQWDSNVNAVPTNGGNTIGINQMFNTSYRNIVEESYNVYIPPENVNNTGTSLRDMNTLNLFVNDVMENSASKIKSMTLADLLTDNVVIMAEKAGGSRSDASKSIEIAGKGMLDYIARIFGYKSLGTGLNIDESTDYALQQAYTMTMRKFLNVKGAVTVGSKDDDQNPLDNSAYLTANSHNRIGIMDNGDRQYAALNLSNMVSAFLTYYDNALRGADSDYVVGKANDQTADGSSVKTYFVTDDPDYVYITNVEDAYPNEEKVNDFFSELYNSLCEHGWRYDGNLDDYEYLESTIKDGRYSLMALNPDGYFYQSKYNDIEYIVEEQDRDAIARAEADFTRKKAEITNKEDIIDIKTKKLDAEITELTTEMNSVQNIISKSIEKTFALFSN